MRWAGILVIAAAFGCQDDASLENRPCPCTDGYTCCETTGLCVKHGAACSPCPCDAGAVCCELAGVCVSQSSECSLEVTPTPARARVGGAQKFTTPFPYSTWSVDEVNGGNIDQAGMYRAPLRPGSYHVRAHAPNGASATGLVQVGPLQLTRAMGQLGGLGTADGKGPEARFSNPTSITGDGEQLYVVDGSGVRRVTLATRRVEHLPSGGLYFAHIALDDGRLFAAPVDEYEACNFSGCHPVTRVSRVVEVDLATGATIPLAGGDGGVPQDGVGAAARFTSITAMTSDGAGSLFVLEGSALRKIDTKSGTVTTLAADPAFGGGWGPSVAFAPFGSLSAIAHSYGSVYLLAHGPQLQQTLWEYDLGSASLKEHQKFQADEWILRAICFSGTTLIGAVQAPGFAGGCAGVIDTTSPSCASSSLAGIGGLWCDLKGNAYVTDSAAGIVQYAKAVEPTVWETLAGEPAHPGPDTLGPSMRLTSPTAITSDTGGDLVFASGGTLIHLERSGALAAHAYDPVNGPTTPMALGASHRLYFVNQESRIGWFDLISGERSMLASAGSQLPTPLWSASAVGLVHDGESSIYFAACGDANGKLKGIDEKTGATTLIAEGGPCGLLTADGTRRLFAAGGNQSLGLIPWPPTFPNLYSIDLASGQLTSLAAPPDGWEATALAFDPAGLLYVAEANRHRIRGVNVDTGEIFDVVGKLGSQGVQLGPLPASLNNPVDIALLPDGSLAITDYAENVLLVAQ